MALALLASAAQARPLQAPIVVDGSFTDWSQVLTNSANTTRDGDASSIGCSLSTDRDSSVFTPDVDLARFAWTWDATSLYLYVERFGPNSARERYLFVHLDVDGDGLLEASDRVLVLGLHRDTAQVTSVLVAYVPGSPAGDPLVDASGFADGHEMAGSLGAVVVADAAVGLGSAPGAERHEITLDWFTLGAPAGSALKFHVSTATGGSVTNADIEDNLGAADGGVGTTAYRGVSASPDHAATVAPQQPLQLVHRIANLGNVASRASFRVTSALGWDVTLREDLDGDGVGDALLGIDAGGDGVMTLPGDALTPEGDTDGDGRLDTGLLAPGEALGLVIEPACPAGSSGVSETLVLAAWIAGTPERSEAIDTIDVGDVTISRDEGRLAATGDVAWLPHVVRDNLGASRRVDVSAIFGQGWSYQIFEDPDGDGDPSDAVPLVDTDGTGLPDVGVAAGAATGILVRSAVPASAQVGDRETAFVRAVVAGVPVSVVVDEVTVAPALELVAHHLLAAGEARFGGAGGSIYFAHRLTNARGVADSFRLSAVSDVGWTTELLSDLDGDGRPHDSGVIPPDSPEVPRNGGVVHFIVRVDVPDVAGVGDVSRVVVSATSRSTPSLSESVVDEAVTAIVRLYEDAAHSVNISQAQPCSTVHAHASGLPPSTTGFRFAWRDSAGTAVRLVDTMTDAQGACSDEWTPGPSDVGGDWRVEIQAWDGFDHVVQDVARFRIGDEVSVAEISVLRPQVHVEGDDLIVEATVINGSYDPPAAGVTLRWLVLSPDRSLVLSTSGSYAPFSGAEATAVETLALQPRELRVVTLRVPSVTHSTIGVHEIEIHMESGCGAAALAGLAAFTVVDDEDHDGVVVDDELAAGTDPQDADSDDDGMPDGEDGLGDSDGDGSIDALDCDSDDDGLFDGTEAGAWSASADTDTAVGCFRADLAPLSTTDPDDPDTDDGGVPDGVEDADGDGLVSAGESDPRDPSDDLAACSPAAPPEVEGLRVRRAAAAARLTWTPLGDPCTSYSVLGSEALPGLSSMVVGVVRPEHVDSVPLGPARIRFYVVQAVSSVAGPGP